MPRAPASRTPSAALDVPDLAAACVQLVRAAGFDLDWSEPRLLLRELLPLLSTVPVPVPS